MHLQHRPLDADRGARLADLPAQPFRVLAGLGSVSRRYSHLPFFIDRRRGGRSRGAPESPARLAVGADVLGHAPHRSGSDGDGPRLAHPLPVVLFRFPAGPPPPTLPAPYSPPPPHTRNSIPPPCT